jgi:hypothetical protein
MLFLAPDKAGGMSEMVSRIKEHLPFEHISIEHLGIVKDGKEDTLGEEVKAWAGAHENYTFKKTGDTTEVLVKMDTVEEYREIFLDTWPRALQKLKSLAET